MLRGEIYYIQRRDTIGDEIAKNRPAIIVSNDILNTTSEVVEVVYLTTQPKRDLPTHVTINSTGVQAVALCEQVDHVYKGLVEKYCARCTLEEMAAIDKALAVSLGLDGPLKAPEPVKLESAAELLFKLEKARAERDVYKDLVYKLLPRSEK